MGTSFGISSTSSKKWSTDLPSIISSDELRAGQWVRNPDNAEQYVQIVSVGRCEELSAESHCDTDISVTAQEKLGEFHTFTIAPKATIEVYLESEIPVPGETENTSTE